VFVIIGLGNPGKNYESNRHNAGFLFLDYLKEKYNFEAFKKKNNYQFLKTCYADAECVFIKPLTYMNLSGNAVTSALSFYKMPKENIIVIYDDTALEFGNIRIRESGSAGGHNGLKSIEQSLGTKDYKRIRIGISSPNYSDDLVNHVLGDFSTEELENLKKDTFDKADKALDLIINFKIKEAMNKYNAVNTSKSPI